MELNKTVKETLQKYPIDIDTLLSKLEMDNGLTFQGDGFAYALRALLDTVNRAYEQGRRDAMGGGTDAMTVENAITICTPFFEEAFQCGKSGEPLGFERLEDLESAFRVSFRETSGREPEEWMVRFTGVVGREMRTLYEKGREAAEREAEV